MEAVVSEVVTRVTPQLGPDDLPTTLADLRQLTTRLAKVLDQTGRSGQSATSRPTQSAGSVPSWIQVSTSRVLDLFLRQLGRSVGWRRIYLVSPWISDTGVESTLHFYTFLERLREYETTLYVVTRPPRNDWHADAVHRLGATGRANIVYVENLHAKLYTASTDAGQFAMLGSANFIRRSFASHEIGILVNATLGGKPLVAHLDREANKIYHTPGRTIQYSARFSFS